MATVITIGGSAVSLPRDLVPLRLVPHVRRGVPTFSFQVRGKALPLLDPYLGKEITLAINGTSRFTGDVLRRDVSWSGGIGWIRTYQCLGLRARGDLVPHVDSNDGADSSSFNAALDNNALDYIAARAGRTVGQILEAILTAHDNAVALDALGIGGYTSLSPPTLPGATATDLAALTVVPPSPVHVGGEKLLTALEGFLATWAPNHTLHVEPDGVIRIRDTRSYTLLTLTLGTDPVLPTPLSRDLTDCFQRVVVRGAQVAEMYLFSVRNGTLSEAPFAHDGLTVAQAKAAWTAYDYFSPTANDEGSCTCPNTATVTVTSDDAARTWAADEWDQTATGRHGQLMLTYSLGSSITMIAHRGVISSDALAAGGTASLTVDRPLPHTNFDTYTLRGLSSGASSVWCEYALPAWAADKVARQSTYPFPYKFSNGSAVTMTSMPIGTICVSSSGDPPYTEATSGIVVDPATGTVRFPLPTYISAGGKVPSDVRALVPIWTAVNEAIAPADSGGPVYTGDSHAVEGLEHTLYVYVPAWRDPLNQAGMDTYAADLLDSVKDAIVEGSVTYLGLLEMALAPGLALSIAGTGHTTPWESVAVPVIEVQLEWGTGPGDPLDHRTVMRCSNRRAHFTDVAFLHPDRTGVTFDFAPLDLSPFAAMLPNTGAAPLGQQAAALQAQKGTEAGYFDWGAAPGNALIGKGGVSHSPREADADRIRAARELSRWQDWDPFA